MTTNACIELSELELSIEIGLKKLPVWVETRSLGVRLSVDSATLNVPRL